MKLANIILIISLILTGCSSTSQIPADNYYDDNNNYNNSNYTANVNYQTFYDELQPYGNWINFPGHGYVWQPYARSGFRPYETDGHWVSTVDGWAWASDHRWGWAPFHYGRWLNDPSIGWAWVPGYEWAPAWVTWGRYNNYYAWAPLAPGVNIGFGNSWRAPSNYWSYAPNNCIGQRNLNRYIVRNNRNPVVVNNITIINNYNSYNKSDYYHRGPDFKEVEQYTHKVIRPASIASANTPGITKVDNNNRFEIYRPAFATIKSESSTAKPMRIKDLNEVKTSGDKTKTPVASSMTGRNTRNEVRVTDNLNEEVADRNGKTSAVPGNTAPGVNNDNRNEQDNRIRPASGSAGNVPDSRINSTNLSSEQSSDNDKPANTENTNRRVRVPANNQEINQQKPVIRDQRPAAEKPERTQPVMQSNQKIQKQNNIQQNNQVIRQPQRQILENRQSIPQSNVQMQRPGSVAPQQPANVNRERPVIRPSRRQ